MLDQIFKAQFTKKDRIKVKRVDFAEKYQYATILITGGAGSIGSALVNELCKLQVKRIVVLDLSELSVFNLKNAHSHHVNVEFVYKVCDVRNEKGIENIIQEFEPTTIIHAAAYKHVQLMEDNPEQAYLTNYLGSIKLFDLAKKLKVPEFIFVSTDKAVEPINMMGLSKKMVEMYLKRETSSLTSIKIIRFGNVLKSSGSLIPEIKRQISSCEDLLIRNKESERYFIHSQVLACTILNILTLSVVKEVYLIEMGLPISILKVFQKMKELLNSDKRIREVDMYSSEKVKESLLENYEYTETIDGYNCFRVKSNNLVEDHIYGDYFNQFKSLENKDFSSIKEELAYLLNSIKYSTFAKNNKNLT